MVLLYELARGPLVWISTLVFLCGIVIRALQLFSLTKKKERIFCPAGPPEKERLSVPSPEEKKIERIVSFSNRLIGKNPVMALVSFIFHSCLFIAPLFALGHSLLFYESWRLPLPSLPDGLIDLLTIVLLACAFFFLIRRMLIPRVQAISTAYDYMVLLLTVAPFLTGFFAYHQWLDYKTVITLHMLAGEAMLVVIPFSKIGHMVFFFFVRILVGSETSFWRGNRTWSP